MRNSNKLVMSSIVGDLQENDLYFYDLMCYFVANSESFLEFLVSNKFLPTRIAGEAYFRANDINNVGAYSDADISYLMYAEIEKVEKHYCEQKRQLTVLFIRLVMAYIAKFSSTINATKYRANVPSVEYFKQLSEIIVKDDTLPMLAIMDVIVAKDGADSVEFNRSRYSYDVATAAKPYLAIIENKLISLCMDTSLTATSSELIVSRILALLVSSCSAAGDNGVDVRVANMFKVNSIKKSISPTEIIMSGKLSDLWGQHVDLETATKNPTEYTATIFITVMHLLIISKEYNRVSNCDVPDPVRGS